MDKTHVSVVASFYTFKLKTHILLEVSFQESGNGNKIIRFGLCLLPVHSASECLGVFESVCVCVC